MIAALPIPANDMGDDQSQGQYREILARLEGQDRRLDEIREDAREGRDAAVRMAERYAAEGVPTKLAELRGQMEQGFQGARTDLVNSMDKTTREMRDAQNNIHARLDALERFKNRIEGAGGVFGWVSKHAPWLLSVFLGGLAVFGLKDRLP